MSLCHVDARGVIYLQQRQYINTRRTWTSKILVENVTHQLKCKSPPQTRYTIKSQKNTSKKLSIKKTLCNTVCNHAHTQTTINWSHHKQTSKQLTWKNPRIHHPVPEDIGDANFSSEKAESPGRLSTRKEFVASTVLGHSFLQKWNPNLGDSAAAWLLYLLCFGSTLPPGWDLAKAMKNMVHSFEVVAYLSDGCWELFWQPLHWNGLVKK